MDRRRTDRHDVQLSCYIAAGRVAATFVQAFTKNISRTGILMRWLNGIPLPAIDSSLTLDIVLPENSDFGQRLLRCKTSVVRVKLVDDGAPEVALRIKTMRFIKAPVSNLGTSQTDLAAMPLTTDCVS